MSTIKLLAVIRSDSDDKKRKRITKIVVIEPVELVGKRRKGVGKLWASCKLVHNLSIP